MLMGFITKIMKDQDSRRRFITTSSVLWLIFCGTYITIYNGWNNIFSLLPHEFFAVLVTIAFPIALLAFLGLMAKIATSIDQMKSEVTAIAQLDPGRPGASAMLAELFQDHHKAIAALLAAQTEATAQIVQVTRDNRDGIVAELRSQTTLSEEMNKELSVIAESRSIPAAPGAGGGAYQRIERMHALAEVLGFALNDLSMTATQLLTELLDNAHGDKDATRKFIATLTNAYFSGDKNVFFRCLAREVESNPETLRRIADDNDQVRQQISKVLREAREVESLVNGCDPNDLVRIVFEDGDLWAMEKSLARHFSVDGGTI